MFQKVGGMFETPCEPSQSQSRVYKINKIYIFFKKYLAISKKSSTFAPDLKNKCLTIKI